MPSPDLEHTLCTRPFPETYEAFMDIQRSETPLLRRRNTIESVQLLMAYNVVLYTNQILNLPTLMLEAEEDDLTLWDPEIKAFNHISSQEIELFVIHETSRMKLYSSRSKLEIPARETTMPLAEHMTKLRKLLINRECLDCWPFLMKGFCPTT